MYLGASTQIVVMYPPSNPVPVWFTYCTSKVDIRHNPITEPSFWYPSVYGNMHIVLKVKSLVNI